MTPESLPILRHRLQSPSAFTPERLMDAVRSERGLAALPVPPLCILDFDGDLSDYLAEQQISSPWNSWACFHTSMRVATIAGTTCGIVPRTIGGPYAVLVSEQLLAAGARLIVGITSAGRVNPDLPLPSIVVANEAIRDEGTSLHYLPPTPTVSTPTTRVIEPLLCELASVSPHTRQGLVWTTDAPYRETREQLNEWAAHGALAVEMQAASVFSFATVRNAAVAVVALVSNSVEHTAASFDTGGPEYRVNVLKAIARAAGTYFKDVRSSPT